jgi:hypothetical protein
VAFNNYGDARKQTIPISTQPFGAMQTLTALAGAGSATREGNNLVLTMPPHSVSLIEAK